jgi:UDP-N-acetylmuramoyl-tripeptide--D-alanyl-D-alanine ligase
LSNAMVSRDQEEYVGEHSVPVLEHSQNLEGTWRGQPPSHVNKVTIDSRECETGSLFVALEGSNSHGHEFVEDARDHGATAAIVEDEQPSEIPQFVVEDAEEALQNLAVAHRAALDDLCVIGVAGSCGKTTVKEMVAHLLSPKYEVGKTPGNYNNELGVPLTLLNESYGDVLVAELGMNAPGEIKQLTEWAKPFVGVVTHIGPEHLEGLGDLRTVAEENGRLLEGVPSDGMAILPGWIDHFDRLSEMSAVAPKVVDKHVDADYRVEWERTPGGMNLTVGVNEYDLRFKGEHLVKDAAISAVVALQLGVPDQIIARRLSSFEPLEGRGQLIQLDGTKILDDGYNANPDSFRAALSRLAELTPPRLALVGDMKELGDASEKYHRDLGEQLSEIDDLDVYFVGEFAQSVEEGYTGRNLRTFENVDQLPELSPQDYESVLVKASNAVGLNDELDRWRDQS